MNPDHRLTKLDKENGLPRLKEKSELQFYPDANDLDDLDPVFRLYEYENSGLYPSEVRRLKENDEIERKLLLDNGFLGVDDLVAAYLRAKSELDAANGVTYETLGRSIRNAYIEGYQDAKVGKPPLEENVPLTMSDIQAMDGQPVWCNSGPGGWALVDLQKGELHQYIPGYIGLADIPLDATVQAGLVYVREPVATRK